MTEVPLSIRGLSLWQPWAAAIPAGLKQIETRGRTLGPYRGPVLICSSKTPTAPFDLPPDLRRAAADLPMHYGCALAVADLVEVLPMKDARIPRLDLTGRRRVDDRVIAVSPNALCISETTGGNGTLLNIESERLWGIFAPGRVGLLLEDVRPLPDPIPVRGSLGLWRVPPEVVAAVNEQLR